MNAACWEKRPPNAEPQPVRGFLGAPSSAALRVALTGLLCASGARLARCAGHTRVAAALKPISCGSGYSTYGYGVGTRVQQEV